MLRNRVKIKDWKAGKEYGGRLDMNIYYSDDDWEHVGNGLQRCRLYLIEIWDGAILGSGQFGDKIQVSFTISNEYDDIIHNISLDVFKTHWSDESIHDYHGESEYFYDNPFYYYRKYNNNEGRWEGIAPIITNAKAYTQTFYFDLRFHSIEAYTEYEE